MRFAADCNLEAASSDFWPKGSGFPIFNPFAFLGRLSGLTAARGRSTVRRLRQLGKFRAVETSSIILPAASTH
jgi:hypothetical protein